MSDISSVEAGEVSRDVSRLAAERHPGVCRHRQIRSACPRLGQSEDITSQVAGQCVPYLRPGGCGGLCVPKLPFFFQEKMVKMVKIKTGEN